MWELRNFTAKQCGNYGNLFTVMFFWQKFRESNALNK